MKNILRNISIILASAVAMPMFSQGILVYKKDGKVVDFPSAEIDSIVTYEKALVNTDYTVNGVTFTMVAVEGGTFMMGATQEQAGEAQDNEKPVHEVTLSNYYIGETEVTQELWNAVMGSNPSHNPSAVDYPVERVTWEECRVFVAKLNELTGENFAMPTEAQWEFAARGGNKSKGYKYSGGNDLGEVAWCYDNADFVTHAVKGKKANELGIYDMSGNVYEWCADWYGEYTESSQVDPEGPASGSGRVFRGGSAQIYNDRDRVSFRYYLLPDQRNFFIGFRLAKAE